MQSKNQAVIDKERCAACGACANVCPKSAIRIWKGCYAQISYEQCVGCGKCVQICPAGCVKIEKRDNGQ